MSPGACGGALKKVLLLLGIMSVMLLPLPGSVSSSVDLVSRYVWHGFDLLPDNRPAIQPALDITLGKSGLTFGVWSSFALAKWSEYREANEIDLYLAYKLAMPEGWDLSAGVYLYSNWFTKRFRFKNGASLEAYATLARTDLPLSPDSRSTTTSTWAAVSTSPWAADSSGRSATRRVWRQAGGSVSTAGSISTAAASPTST